MFEPVVFVSLGPGDPELITLKGLKVLQQADIIYCPSTTTRQTKTLSRAKDILLALDIDEKKITTFEVPMNKDRAKAIEAYNKVSEDIAGRYKADCKIAVTAEGDAGFYSSVHYIAENLCQENIPTIKIAGVPAFIACGALANMHIVSQEEELNVVPGIISRKELIQKIEVGNSVVIMKPSQSEQVIKDVIDELPGVTFHYFENVGIQDKEFYTCKTDEILARKFPYFSLLIIRKN